MAVNPSGHRHLYVPNQCGWSTPATLQLTARNIRIGSQEDFDNAIAGKESPFKVLMKLDPDTEVLAAIQAEAVHQAAEELIRSLGETVFQNLECKITEIFNKKKD